MQAFVLLSLIWFLLPNQTAPAQTAPKTPASPEEQIASAVLAAPEERRAEAAVLGYDAQGKLVTLRKGTNDLICLATILATTDSASPAITKIWSLLWREVAS
jgi:hypothetical protein